MKALAHDTARTRAAAWLRTLDPSTLDPQHHALQGLGLLLAERKVSFLRLMQGTGPAARIPAPATLATASRARILRLMAAITAAPAIRTRRYTAADLALCLGALSVSFARAADITVTATILRAAGRLRCHSPLLDEACLFLLDQQSTSGAFGLLSATPPDPDFARMRLQAHLQATVDILSALDAYLPA